MARKTSSSAARRSKSSAKKSRNPATRTAAAKNSSRSRKSSRSVGAKRGSRSRASDRSKVNVHEPYELRYWTQTLGVTPKRLKDLVTKYGPGAAGIRRALTGSRKRSRSADRSRINVHQPYELRYWTKALGVTADRLKALVKEHGPTATGIRRKLGLS